MQMRPVSKIQFGQLNDKRFYFSNGIVSLPYGHPQLEPLRSEKHKFRAIHTVIQDKNREFLKVQVDVLRNNKRLNVLNQILQQKPKLYLLNSLTESTKNKINKSTKEYIKSNSYS